MIRGQWMQWLAVGLMAALGKCSAIADEGGVIKGKVIFKGDKDAYKRSVLDTSKDPNCKKKVEKIGSEEVVLNTKTDPVTIRNVIVHVKEGVPDQKYPVPSEPAVLDQHGCQYRPRVLALMEGQKLEIRNSDPTNHNIHFLPKKNQEFNKSQPKEGMVDELTLVKEEPFHVKCDVHPWMGAHIAVFNHPYFSVTGEEGTFEIKGLPAGKYVVEAWHEKFGTQKMEVEVASGAAVEKDFTYEPK